MRKKHYLLYLNKNRNIVQVELQYNAAFDLFYHVFTEDSFVLGSTWDYNQSFLQEELPENYVISLAGLDITGMTFIEVFYFKNNVSDFTGLNQSHFRQAGTVFYRLPGS